MSFVSLMALGVLVVVFLCVMFLALGFINLYGAMLFGAPFVPSNTKKIDAGIRYLVGRKRVLELGSGDGRVALALARENDRVRGVEINPYLVYLSRFRAKRSGFGDRIEFVVGNFWSTEVSGYDGVYIYGISYIMERLQKKLRQELDCGARVVSVGFPFPDWEPIHHEKSVWVYEQTNKNTGREEK